MFASPKTLSSSLDVLGDIAELRRAKETATFFVEQGPREQAEWTADLADRTTHAGPDAPAVCVLDTGTAEYPDLWPETIRALVVHSAEWTDAMRGHLAAAGGKTARAQLVRRYGFDVPNIDRATTGENEIHLHAFGEIHHNCMIRAG